MQKETNIAQILAISATTCFIFHAPRLLNLPRNNGNEAKKLRLYSMTLSMTTPTQ